MLRKGPIMAELFRALPDSLENVVKYVESLTYQETPDYDYIIAEMTRKDDEVLDWMKEGVKFEKPAPSPAAARKVPSKNATMTGKVSVATSVREGSSVAGKAPAPKPEV